MLQNEMKILGQWVMQFNIKLYYDMKKRNGYSENFTKA